MTRNICDVISSSEVAAFLAKIFDPADPSKLNLSVFYRAVIEDFSEMLDPHDAHLHDSLKHCFSRTLA